MSDASRMLGSIIRIIEIVERYGIEERPRDAQEEFLTGIASLIREVPGRVSISF